MNRESIIAIEGEPDINEHKYLAYNRTIATFDCFAVFYLESDEVTVAAYIFTEEHTNRNLFLDDFESLNELLTRKYGAPTSDGTVWKNDLYKDDANDWGSAVAYGHLRFITSWETDRTRIMHVLSGDNYEISHAINYLSKEFEDLNRSADAETLDDL